MIKGARRATSRNTCATSYSYHPLAESLLIKTFGNDVTSQPTEREKVKVSVGNINKLSSREIKVLVVPTICSPIRSQEINTAKNQFAHLQDIELADSNHGNEELQIDLLIGADFMWSFFTSMTKRAENDEGPVAKCTIFRMGPAWSSF